MASVVATAIRHEGHTVMRAGSVAAVFEMEESFDHAVLDIDLPDGTGVALAHELLETGRVRSVVFFTASRDIEMLGQAATLGLLVDKSSGAECLLAAVRQLTACEHSDRRVAVAGSPQSISSRDSGRSGMRRKIDSE